MQRDTVFKLTLITVCVALTCKGVYETAHAASDVRIGNYLLPGAFAQALHQGMTVPVLLRLKGRTDRQTQKIAEARVILDNGHLGVNDITLIGSDDGAHLSEETQTLLSSVKNQIFDAQSSIVLSPNAELRLNLRAFTLTLDVNERALDTALIPRTSILAPSSVRAVSSVLNYDLGVYRSQNRHGENTTNSYLNLDDTFGFAEHHFNINGSIYGLGEANRESRLYRAMYERDANGRRLALGLLDTWNLQSTGAMSALNSSKVYGFSWGSKSDTRVKNNQQSLTPITVFLPSAGEIHIYREGKLLNIQNFPMGSFEVDTGRLPYGIYDVEVETVVDGKVLTRQRQTINKAFSTNGLEMNRWTWQIFGGSVDYENRSRWRDGYRHGTDKGEKTWLGGLSAAVSYPVLSGLSLQTSNYGFDRYLVNESSINLALNKYGSISWQGLLAKGGRYRNIINLALNLPGNYGSLWVNREKSHIGNGLPVYDSDSYAFGGTLNLNRLFMNAGQITASHNRDNRDHSWTNNLEYSTSLYAAHWGSINLRAGLQRYQYRESSASTNQRYITLDFSLPLATWISAGMSSNNGNIKANLTASKNFNNSPITSVGLNMSKLLKDKNNGESDVSASGYASYDTKYSAGNISLSRPDNERLNGNLTSRGTIAYGSGNLAASGGQEKSGVIVKTGIDDGAVLAAQVNGRPYRLSGQRNFIPLPSYGSYQVELMNDKNAEDSFDIASGRVLSFTLYPGNVAVYEPEIKQLVTVFGRITDREGQAIANAPIRNHIGRTQTDAQGQFAMDVDKRFPAISLSLSNAAVCEADLDLKDARGVKWVGNIICQRQVLTAQR